jgi:hypothetical protein
MLNKITRQLQNVSLGCNIKSESKYEEYGGGASMF